MNEQETIADIIAEKRRVAEQMRNNLSTVPVRQWDQEAEIKSLEEEADRIEAAWKREKSVIEADALAVGGIVGAAHGRELSKNASKNGADFGQLGDCAKLREALEKIDAMETPHNFQIERSDIADACYDLTRAIKLAHAALAAPSRNCDRFASAEEAWDAYDAWVESYRAQGKTEPFNEFGWLYAAATEKEGGAK